MKSYVFQSDRFGLELGVKRSRNGMLLPTRQLSMLGRYAVIEACDEGIGDEDKVPEESLLPSIGFADVTISIVERAEGQIGSDVSGFFGYLDIEANSIEVSLSYPTSYADWLARIHDSCLLGGLIPTLFFELMSKDASAREGDKMIGNKRIKISASGKMQDGDIKCADLIASRPRVDLRVPAA
jgi:hypothetical protein